MATLLFAAPDAHAQSSSGSSSSGTYFSASAAIEAAPEPETVPAKPTLTAKYSVKNETFQDYIMYTPPTPPSGNSIAVPLFYYQRQNQL